MVTDRTKIGSHEIKASADDPPVAVKSEKTGKKAARKPGTLGKA